MPRRGGVGVAEAGSTCERGRTGKVTRKIKGDAENARFPSLAAEGQLSHCNRVPPAVGFAVPAGQSAQVWNVFQYRPAAHGSQPVCAAFVTFPGRHSRQSSPQPLVGEYWPSGHVSQDVAPLLVAWDPGAHHAQTSNMPARSHWTGSGFAVPLRERRDYDEDGFFFALPLRQGRQPQGAAG